MKLVFGSKEAEVIRQRDLRLLKEVEEVKRHPLCETEEDWDNAPNIENEGEDGISVTHYSNGRIVIKAHGNAFLPVE